MTSVTPWNSTDGLPKQFIASMKILFDILDEKRCGYVHLDDIETRWHEEGVKGLPGGVTEALRKVTPSDGYLSFDRFVAGLKLALLTSRREPRQLYPDKRNNREKSVERIIDRGKYENNVKNEERRSETDNIQQQKRYQDSGFTQKAQIQRGQSQNSNTAAVQPNNVRASAYEQSGNQRRQRPVHKETMKEDTKLKNLERKQIYDQYYKKVNSDGKIDPGRNDYKPVVPAKPAITKQGVNSSGQVPPQVPPRDKSKRIITELKNWQRRVNGTVQQTVAKDKIPSSSSDSKLLEPKSDSKQPNYDLYENIENFHKHSNNATSTPVSAPSPRQSSATVKRRDSARRHTLANGVDYNMIKRMKQLEQEKDILLRGLEMVEKARDWYHKQVVAVEEKQKYVGKAALNDHSLEATQERMNFQHARVMEVNQQLRTLIESSERGFPLHMNLAMGPTKTELVKERSSAHGIQEQNQKMSKELKDKTEKISQLEKEKATLIRELFEARSKNKNYDDTTFL